MITNSTVFAKPFKNPPLNFLFSDDSRNPSGCLIRCYNITNTGFLTDNDMLDQAGLGYNAKVTFYASGF